MQFSIGKLNIFDTSVKPLSNLTYQYTNFWPIWIIFNILLPAFRFYFQVDQDQDRDRYADPIQHWDRSRSQNSESQAPESETSPNRMSETETLIRRYRSPMLISESNCLFRSWPLHPKLSDQRPAEHSSWFPSIK